MRRPNKTLIATLGTEAQVVTLTLDFLLSQSEPVDRVLVIHTAPPGGPVAEAVARVKAEFEDAYYSPDIQLNMLALHDRERPLADVDTPAGSRAAFLAIYRAVRAAKLAQRGVHLSIAGGRKTMAVFGMAAAQMLFDDEDRLWHLVSYGDLLAEKRMHARPGEAVSVVNIPVLPWAAVSPAFTDLEAIDDPFAAIERQRDLRLQQAFDEARVFVLSRLTEAERRVVELLVREGLGDVEIALRIDRSSRTIEGQIAEARAKAAEHWGYESVSRTQLVALLNYYYRVRG